MLASTGTDPARTPEPLAVSIIVPAYNAAATLADALHSVLAQTHPYWEVIVVDDGSRDGTGRIARAFAARDARIRTVRQRNGGVSTARNTGIAQARHDWLLFLDADDWILPAHLERLTAELRRHPELDAVHCGYERVAADGTRVVETYAPPVGDLFPTLARRAAFAVHGCLVRKAVVEAVGKLDPSLHCSADWDLWQRVARSGARFGAVREVLACYRMRPQSSSLRARELLRDGLVVLRRGHAPDPRVPRPDPQHARGMPPEEVRSQEFYLLCWCAGIVLGHGDDAVPLLDDLAGHTYPDLYPDAVAQCIFEAAPLPTSQPPRGWEALWPRLRPRIEAFLAALETHSTASDLARRAHAALGRMILRHAASWQPFAEDYEQALAVQRVRIDGLEDATRARTAEHEVAIRRLEEERAAWQGMAEERRRTVDEQARRLARLAAALTEAEAARTDLDRTVTAQRARLEELSGTLARTEHAGLELRRTVEEHARTIDAQQARLEELERRAADLAATSGEWRGHAEARARTIDRQRAQLRALDQESSHWEQLAHEFAARLATLRRHPWVRLGRPLGLCRNLATEQEQLALLPGGPPR